MLSRKQKRKEDRTVCSSGEERRSSTNNRATSRSLTPVDQSGGPRTTRSSSLDRDLGSAGIDTSQKLLRGPDEPHLLLKKSETRKKHVEFAEDDCLLGEEDRLAESQCSNGLRDNKVDAEHSLPHRAVSPSNVLLDQPCSNKVSSSKVKVPLVQVTTHSSSTQPMSPTSTPMLPSTASVSVPASSLSITCTGESSYDMSPIDSGACILNPSGEGSSLLTSKINCFSRETQTEQGTSTSAQGTQTSEGCSLVGGDLSTSYSHSQQQQHHLQPRLEALSLSNELLKTSLDDARRQVASLQSTVESQREELVAKENQISMINRRISALLRGFESTESSSMHYKDLYHKAVQQNGILQEQINQFKKMFISIQNFLSILDVSAKQLQSNKQLLDSWKEDIKSREDVCLGKIKQVYALKAFQDEMMEESHKLKLSNRTLQCSNEVLTVQLAKQLTRASVMSAGFRLSLQEAQETEIYLIAQNHDLQGKLAHLLDSFKRAKDEFQESSEFSAMEREMLLETNMELEQEVKRLKNEIQQGEEEFQKLVNYIKQYQEECTEKTNILKANLAKSDKEIEELDKLVEQIRVVMHDNLDSISQSKPLMCVYEQLSGEEMAS